MNTSVNTFVDPLLDKRLKSMDVIKTSNVLVSPEIAMDWLTRNKTNRPTRQGIVNSYSKQMLAGQWKNGTGESIKFDDKGRLIDGQHRLQAIIKSGKSIYMEVKTNMDFNARRVIDTGTKRIAADLIAMEGYSNPIQVAATAKFVLLFKSGSYASAANREGGKQKTFFSNVDILRYVKENEQLVEIINDFQGVWYKSFKYLSVSVMSGLYILFSEKSQRAAEDFFEKLSKGDGLGQTNPIFLLREKLRSDRSARRRMQNTERLALCITAWNLFREGKKTAFLAYSENEKFPKPI